MRDPFDLANVVMLDHTLAETLFRRLERGEGERDVLLAQVVFSVSVHAGAEEAVMYPLLRTALHNGDEAADDSIADHQAVKQALVVVDDGDADPVDVDGALITVMEVVRRHARAEEDELLPRLREALGDERMLELGIAFQREKARLPTHPHPHAPATPPGSTIAGAVAGLIDKLRDRGSDRAGAAAIDGSGLLNPQAQDVVDQLAALGIQPIEVLDPAEARMQPTPADAVSSLIEARGGRAEPETVGQVEERLAPAPTGDIRMRIYTPVVRRDGLLPVLIYVHGGGWVIGDLDSYDASARALANRAGCLVVSVEYRHAPEAHFPAAHDDVLSAARWVLNHARELGGDPDRIAIGGESAGGNMAAATCLALKREGAVSPIFQLLIYPVTSGVPRTASYAENADAKPLNPAMMAWFGHHVFANPDDAADPRVSLLDVPLEELQGLPPAFVITAGRDPLRDEGELYAARLRAARIPTDSRCYDGVPHEFFGMGAVVDEADRAVEDAADHLRRAFQAVGAV